MGMRLEPSLSFGQASLSDQGRFLSSGQSMGYYTAPQALGAAGTSGQFYSPGPAFRSTSSGMEILQTICQVMPSSQGSTYSGMVFKRESHMREEHGEKGTMDKV